MLRKIAFILLAAVQLSSFVMAVESAREGSVIIDLLFPDTGGRAMKAPRPISKPMEISGQVFVDISQAPSKTEKDRYLVEYFLDDSLIYQTTGSDKQIGAVAFGYIFDTTKYENGRYKIIVNFWDESGPSAIGVMEVMINNKSGE